MKLVNGKSKSTSAYSVDQSKESLYSQIPSFSVTKEHQLAKEPGVIMISLLSYLSPFFTRLSLPDQKNCDVTQWDFV